MYIYISFLVVALGSEDEFQIIFGLRKEAIIQYGLSLTIKHFEKALSNTINTVSDVLGNVFSSQSLYLLTSPSDYTKLHYVSD